MAQPRKPTNHQSRFSKLYVVAWAFLGLAALVYVSALYARPHWLASPFGRPASEQESNKGTRSLSKAMAELETLRRNERALEHEIGLLRRAQAAGELAKARAATAGKAEAGAPRSPAAEEIAARFSGDGTASKTSNSQPGAEPANPARAYRPSRPIHLARATDQAEALADKSTRRAQAALAGVQMIGTTADGGGKTDRSDARAKTASAPKAAKLAVPAGTPAGNPEPRRKIAAPKVNAFGDSAKIETGSINAPGEAIGFGPAIVTRTKPPAVGVRLASGPSLNALRLSWLLLTDRHGSTLGNLKPRYTASGPRGVRRYRLVAGPLRSTTAASRMCADLRRQDVTCNVATFRGRPF